MASTVHVTQHGVVVCSSIHRDAVTDTTTYHFTTIVLRTYRRRYNMCSTPGSTQRRNMSCGSRLST
eukprot:26064-Eustigmatos_ZCMA.PRE.1